MSQVFLFSRSEPADAQCSESKGFMRGADEHESHNMNRFGTDLQRSREILVVASIHAPIAKILTVVPPIDTNKDEAVVEVEEELKMK